MTNLFIPAVQFLRMADLARLRAMATTMAHQWQEDKEANVVGDIVMNARTSTLRVGLKQVTFRPVDVELFKKLVQNDGIVLSRKRFLHPFRHFEFTPATQVSDL
jgi:DNA-binding response OmpR family regulator